MFLAFCPHKYTQKPKRKKTRVDTCKVQLDRIARYQKKLDKYACYVEEEYTPMNCQEIAKVDKGPDVMKVTGLKFENRSCSHTSAILLPNNRPYSDKQYSVELLLAGLEIPYDPPFSVAQKVLGANVNATLILKINGVNTDTKESGILRLDAKVIKLNYSKP